MNPLSKNSILLNLHIRMWAGEVGDRRALAVVAQTFNSDTSNDKYRKSLFVGEPLKPIHNAGGRIRTHFYKETLPWLDGGNGRLIPSRGFKAFSQKHKQLCHNFYAAVDTFTSAYPQHKATAKLHKKELYNEQEYPTDVRDRFSVSLGALPFPEATDFRIDAPEETIRELQAAAENAIASVAQTVQTEISTRFCARVNLIITSLTENKRFRNDVFNDEFVRMALNMRDCLPSNLITKIEHFQEHVLGQDPDRVRKSRSLRAIVLAECRKLL